MTTVVAVHQPNFAPWLGYFHKMRTADVFVLLDDVQFSKNSFTNRVRIQSGRWLSVPVRMKLGTPINQVRTADPGLPDRHWGILRAGYGRLRSIDEFVALERSLLARSDLLVDVNVAVLEFLRPKLGIDTPMVRSSQLGVDGTSTHRLVSIVSALGGDRYLSGSGGRTYQDEATFRQAGIDVSYSDFDDKGGGAGLSALHALLSRPDHDFGTGAW